MLVCSHLTLEMCISWSLEMTCWKFPGLHHGGGECHSPRSCGFQLFEKKHAKKIKLCLWLPLPETNIAPGNWWLEDDFPFEMVPFQGTFQFSGRCKHALDQKWWIFRTKTRMKDPDANPVFPDLLKINGIFHSHVVCKERALFQTTLYVTGQPTPPTYLPRNKALLGAYWPLVALLRP